MNVTRFFFAVLGSLLLAAPALAQQYELKAGNFNSLFPAGPPAPISPPPSGGQFSAVGAISGSAGPISNSATFGDRYPANADKSLVLTRASIGGVFASGLPRYSMGEVIVPPLTQANGITPAAPDYWRVKPVAPGEAVYFDNQNQVPLPIGTVSVTQAATNSSVVTVASVTPELVLGATLLGQPITNILGTSVTLGGNANATISSATPLDIIPPLTYYYSPHAEQVFASQPGRVSITWMSRVPVNGLNHEVITETFAVSSTTQSPIRTIYWTEGGFDGPKVQITDGRITSVNPIYYSAVPKAVKEEIQIPGYNPITPNLKTLSFEKFNGVGQLQAYNVEGRIFIEYLGNVRLAGNIHEYVGSDVVDIKRVPALNYSSVHLGKEILPHNGDTSLTPSPVLASAQNAANFYGTSLRPDNTLIYHAERSTSPENIPDNGSPASVDAFNKVVFYWLQTGTFGINWPVFQDRYWLRWSPNLTDYAHYTVDPGGSTPENGISFSGGILPQLVFQDDLAQTEAAIDTNTQRFHVNPGSNQRNRSLLKFTSGSDLWYVNIYTQTENRAKELVSASTSTATTTVTVSSTDGLLVGMPVTGPGITGTATIVSILNGTQLILSQNIPDGTNELNYNFFDMATSMSIVPGSANPFFLEQGTWRVNGSATTATAEIESPEMLVTSAGPVTLNMIHSYNFEPAYDGGRLLVSRNGGGYSVVNVTGQTTMNPGSGGGVAWTASQSNVTSNAVLFPDGVVGDSYRFRLIATWDQSWANPSPNWTIGSITLNNGNGSVTLSSTSQTRYSPSILTVSTTTGLEVGMIVTGPGITGSATITRIINGTTLEISQTIPNATSNLSYTVQSDAAAPINAAATVGTRLPPPAGHENAGYISSGTAYHPASYQDPIQVGVPTANTGAIIPVNALPGKNSLTVRWFRKIPAPKPAFRDLYVPGKVGRYTLEFPATTTPEIVIASGVGTGDLPPELAVGTVYYQNDANQLGYNPNEEHAFIIGGRAYALRDDLNIATTSQPCVLIAYTDVNDQRPAMRAYKVIRSNEDHDFDYTATAGTMLVRPYPLPLMALPLVGTGSAMRSKDVEINGLDNPANSSLLNDVNYTGFTFQDRKGFVWVHRGPHNPMSSPTFSMKLYYPSREGFFIPGASTQPAVGTVLPFLRNPARSGQTLDPAASNVGQIDEPLLITYRPAWPEQAPELRVAETLTLPKFGLPQVRGQTSASVIYQQSLAITSKPSVTLHDPTREKTAALGTPGIALTEIPGSIATTNSDGKTYFQGLPPHLQQRFFLDPLRGTKGALVFLGEFHDVIAGEDYLDLNVLTAADLDTLQGLAASSDPMKAMWNSAIEGLRTDVETFIENPAQAGTFIVGGTEAVSSIKLAEISHPDTAVDSYAITATGKGTGFVTMVFGDGAAFTPEGDPVQVKVFKVAPQLYTGDLKAVASSNPLDEQVSLRHSGDFAGKPEEYEFEWRWATGAATAPAVYTTSMEIQIGNTGTANWRIVGDPGAMRATAAQYAAVSPNSLPRAVNVNPAGYTADEKSQGIPAVILKSETVVDFTDGVPGDIIFSAALGSLDGFVLYVNGQAAAAYKAPVEFFTEAAAFSGLSPAGLPLQFKIAPSYFTAGVNTIEVAIYSNADPNVQSDLNFRLEAATETDAVIGGSVWQAAADPEGVNTNIAIVGGSPANPFGGAQFVINDRWFTMRYRPKASADNVLGTPYSRWMPPQLVEGWVKRVLAAINPFEQRVKDLNASGINTDISVLTQAGTRWEGDIALTLSNINDVGLIEIYETVLNRAKAISIDANTNDPDTNNALILAAGYLNDLYTLVGNEAYADAANPTISVDDQGSAMQVNTSRFSFEGQVASSLDEELALLRGRDDFVSPGVGIAPAYNRLYWNYTRGINSGEAIYALNYNIREKAGSGTANGVIDEADAQRMFPQGHGDAYGHYLTALTGYYKLLSNENFTWTPRAEAVTVLGQPVTVDYFDERKFAGAAGNVARAAEQVLALTWRKSYKDDPSSGWNHFRDRLPANPQTGVTRRQGLDEWASRSTQGALFHWAVANSLLPAEDNFNTGIQKIDRTTVPEIAQLPMSAASFQTTMDNANSHLNPLGLSPSAIAFDISPADLTSGISHYEQISSRALVALNNAAGAFNQAAIMTGALRNQEISMDDFNTSIVEQEYAYEDALNAVFGRPYAGDIGPGKTYAQGYTGPDLFHWYIVDRPNNLVDTGKTFTVTLSEALEFKAFTTDKIADIVNGLDNNTAVTTRTVTVQPSQFVQYNDVWKSGGLGMRAESGELQDALLDAQQTYLALVQAKTNLDKEAAELRQLILVINDLVRMHEEHLSELGTSQTIVIALESVKLALETTAAALAFAAEASTDLGDTLAEFFPRSVGVSNDATSSGRGAAMASSNVSAMILDALSIASQAGAGATGIGILKVSQDLERELTKLGFGHEEKQAVQEFATAYRNLVSHSSEMMQLTIDHQRALQNVTNVLAKGNQILAYRELFRQRAAAVVQGYRTRDVTFRLFRNEALEQYRSLFDLASRYSYLAAKSYDYETGLLGTPQGQGIFKDIVASRSLGDLAGGMPQLTTSSLGDAGLAGSMAKLNADFSVAKGRLGINNPDQNGTVFSMRAELFRIRTDAAITADDDAWQQTIEQHITANVLADPDVATYCRNIHKADGGAVPGIIIPFSTTIEHGKNFFGLDLAAGDHAYTPSNFATKIHGAGLILPGYVGMDAYASGGAQAGAPASSDPNALSATPYVYLIPCGFDSMLAPPLGDSGTIRSWKVEDQALPLPFNLGASAFSSTQFFSANGTLSENPWIIRKHQAFRAISDPSLFYGEFPTEFTNSRLVGRSVWNSKWKLVIPGYTLLNDEQEGLNRFAASVDDIQLFLRTYSHSGN